MTRREMSLVLRKNHRNHHSLVTDGDGPYKMKAAARKWLQVRRGPTVRHYASGKDDDKTIEKNVKDIKAKNYQFLVNVKITTTEHSDTCSLKYGGTHMKVGWFDNTVSLWKKRNRHIAKMPRA